MISKVLLAAMIAASLGGGIATSAHAATVYVKVAPPPMPAEVAPPARRGYVWAPGYWNWRGQRHVWVKGAWMRARNGYAYHVPTWQERDGRWFQQRGRWARGDRDGDGVPNRLDRRPDDPRRN